MSERTHLLVQQWLQHAYPKADLDLNLQQLLNTYPYFSAANLFLFNNGLDDTIAGLQKSSGIACVQSAFSRDR